MIGFSSSWFVKGLSHPAMTPSHIILLLAIGLLLGQQGKTHFLRSCVLFAIALLGGFLLNHYLPASAKNMQDNELILLIIALSISLLTLLKLDLATLVILIIMLASGVMLGLDSTPVMIPGLSNVSSNSWLLGAACGILGIVVFLALISLLLRHVLSGMILRVLASWIAASALFVLTLMIGKA